MLAARGGRRRMPGELLPRDLPAFAEAAKREGGGSW